MGPTDEDEEYYEECVQLKNELGLDNVVFTGRVNVLEYLEKIDFTLLTSISEGQPLAVLEAMSAGRPAVTTDVGCCRELLEGNVDGLGASGLCVPVMHQNALADAMLTLCEDAPLRHEMGRIGVKRVNASYLQATMLAHYQRVFEEAARAAEGGDRDGGNRV